MLAFPKQSSDFREELDAHCRCACVSCMFAAFEEYVWIYFIKINSDKLKFSD